MEINVGNAEMEILGKYNIEIETSFLHMEMFYISFLPHTCVDKCQDIIQI